jgi:sortase A
VATPVRNHWLMRRVLRIVSVAMVTAGLVLLVDAGLTLAWKEPVSALYVELKQGQARSELDSLTSGFLEGTDLDRTAEAQSSAAKAGIAERLANEFEAEIRNGEGIGTIESPAADFDYVVIEGTDTEALKKGPGRYPDTALPGQGETIGIAGHRTTYGAPFRRIDELGEGDRIAVEMPYGTFEYEFEKSRIVEPTAVGIVRNVGSERLVLTACHPLYSAAERYAVFARLVSIELPSRA